MSKIVSNSDVISRFDFETHQQEFYPKDLESFSKTYGLRSGHTCSVYGNCLWFVGGYALSYRNDTWCHDLTTGGTYMIKGISFESPRSGHTVVEHGGKLYLFGGWNGRKLEWYNDIWVLDLQTVPITVPTQPLLSEYSPHQMNWRLVTQTGDIPGMRCSHMAVTFGDCMYIFGGYDGRTYLSHLEAFDLNTCKWSRVQAKGPVPPARSRSRAWVYNGCMYVLGGWDRQVHFDDFWCFDFGTKIWREIRGNVPKISQFDVAVHKNLLFTFGGFDANLMDSVNTIYVSRLE